jgi:hypothetical protein
MKYWNDYGYVFKDSVGLKIWDIFLKLLCFFILEIGEIEIWLRKIIFNSLHKLIINKIRIYLD